MSTGKQPITLPSSVCSGNLPYPMSFSMRGSGAVLAMLLAKATGRWVASRTTASRQANASLTTALQEQLAGIRVLRLFGRTGAAVERVDRLSEEQADTNLALVRLRGGLRPVYTTIMTEEGFSPT